MNQINLHYERVNADQSTKEVRSPNSIHNDNEVADDGAYFPTAMPSF